MSSKKSKKKVSKKTKKCNNEDDTIDINDIDKISNSLAKIKIGKTAIVKKKAHKRTVMYLNDDETKPITAGGSVFYKNIKGKMMLLIIENNNKYEDIGGKIDPDDENIYTAVAREIIEETNGLIADDKLASRLEKASYAYVPKSKYVIFILSANSAEKVLKKKDFGEYEEHDNIKRTIGWISREELCKSENIQFRMNWRMKSKALFDKLLDIENKFKYKINLFKNYDNKS
jgi:hypothetical protein